MFRSFHLLILTGIALVGCSGPHYAVSIPSGGTGPSHSERHAKVSSAEFAALTAAQPAAGAVVTTGKTLHVVDGGEISIFPGDAVFRHDPSGTTVQFGRKTIRLSKAARITGSGSARHWAQKP